MVLISNGNTEIGARKEQSLLHDLFKAFDQITDRNVFSEKPYSLHAYATCSDLPSNIRTIPSLFFSFPLFLCLSLLPPTLSLSLSFHHLHGIFLSFHSLFPHSISSLYLSKSPYPSFSLPIASYSLKTQRIYVFSQRYYKYQYLWVFTCNYVKVQGGVEEAAEDLRRQHREGPQ